VLYSPAVQNRYYELKNQTLSNGDATFCKNNSAMEKEIDDNLKKIKDYSGAKYSSYRNLSYVEEEKILEDLKNKIMSLFVDSKAEYCKLYGRGEQAFLEKIEDLSVNLTKINYFTSNFALPNPFSSPRTILTSIKHNSDKSTKFDLSEVSDESFVVEFLSNLRLHNRSEKRHIKNIKDFNDDIRETANHIWNVTPEYSVEVKHNFTDTYGRDELVRFRNKDKASYIEIISGQTDEEWSILLRDRINIKRDAADLSLNILSLWYLIFGCDFIKHPASLIHINMVLDLAEAGRAGFSRKDLSINCRIKIPMSNNVLSSVMYLNELYTVYMPHKYKYNKYRGYDKKHELIKYEEDLTREWMEFKLGKSVSDYLITQCVND
jgi:hypothetical protein